MRRLPQRCLIERRVKDPWAAGAEDRLDREPNRHHTRAAAAGGSIAPVPPEGAQGLHHDLLQRAEVRRCGGLIEGRLRGALVRYLTADCGVVRRMYSSMIQQAVM